MEGIVDGAVVEGCFVCELLWPGTPTCPRCGGRARWRAARLASPGRWTALVTAAAARWRQHGDVADLIELLELAHADPVAAGDALASAGLDLDLLRAAWRDAHPDQTPAD